MLTVTNIFKRYGPVRVLLGASFSVARGQKIALVGSNGAGKSTLLRILAGVESEDRGKIVKHRRALVGYLPQEIVPDTSNETLFQYFCRVSGIAAIEEEMKEIEGKLEDERFLVRYGELQTSYERLGGYVFEQRARRALDGLGLVALPLDRNMMTLSGGERRRAAISATLLAGADLLLLDEPTNDLDLEALLFLETYLRETDAAVVIASHDRAFLDRVAEKVLEIDWHARTTTMYSGNWSAYRAERAERIRRARDEQFRSEDERYRLRGTAEEKRVWAKIGAEQKMPDHDTMSQGFHRNRSEQKFHAAARAISIRAQKVKEVIVPPIRESLALLFSPKKGEDCDVKTASLVVGYPDTDFRVAVPDLELSYGNRIGIFGRNGSGKSTLLRTIAGEVAPVSGSIARGADVKVGFLSQDCGIVPRSMTAVEWFSRETSIRDEDALAEYLGKFVLNPSVINFRLGEISPGERMRMALAFFMATGVNVLLLDEPTNHLDIDAIEALERALDLYQGTLFLVSHDRMFLGKVSLKSAYAVGKGAFVRYPDAATYFDTIAQDAEQGAKALRVCEVF